METLKNAQDLIKASNPHVRGGFNQFIHGTGEPVMSDYGDKSQWAAESQGYEFAKKMAEQDCIAFTHVFKCGQAGCFPFSFGGSFVCNSCGRNELKKDWWEIKVEKDGDSFCCHGLDFINLQESENYAFGDTFNEAIANYETVMLNKN
jgi:hypothetical protein